MLRPKWVRELVGYLGSDDVGWVTDLRLGLRSGSNGHRSPRCNCIADCNMGTCCCNMRGSAHMMGSWLRPHSEKYSMGCS